MEVIGRVEIACVDTLSKFVVGLFEYCCCLNLGYSFSKKEELICIVILRRM